MGDFYNDYNMYGMEDLMALFSVGHNIDDMVKAEEENSLHFDDVIESTAEVIEEEEEGQVHQIADTTPF